MLPKVSALVGAVREIATVLTWVAVQDPQSVPGSRYGGGEAKHYSIPSRLEDTKKLSSCEHPRRILVKTFQLKMSRTKKTQSPKDRIYQKPGLGAGLSSS